MLYRTQLLSKTFKFCNKLLELQSRCLANAAQPKTINGSNGERIISSPYGNKVEYPEMPVADFMWENIKDFKNLVALVR